MNPISITESYRDILIKNQLKLSHQIFCHETLRLESSPNRRRAQIVMHYEME